MQRPTSVKQTSSVNAPMLEHDCGTHHLRGWSRAGVQTYWHVPEWRLAIDQGAHPWQLANATVLALTHFHADHAAGLVSFLSTRNLLGQSPPVVIFPSLYEERLRAYLAAWESLSGDVLHYELSPVDAGDEVALGAKRVLRAFESVHVVPTLGYAVYERRSRLLPEYVGSPGAELGALRQRGVKIEMVEDVPMLAFCGDTTEATLDRNPFLYDVRTLILECTFLGAEPDPSHARSFGHVHLEALVERAQRFNCERLVLSHFSNRHSDAEISATLEARLPSALLARVVPWF